MSDRVKLPGQRSHQPVKEIKFPPGTKVMLTACPHGMPGVVLRAHRGRIEVKWSDLGYVGRHRPSSLIVAIVGTESPAGTSVVRR
jgi:hypothetical protein